MNSKWEIQFKTISPVALSPRIQGALYSGIDFRQSPEEKAVRIIYPFYSHEDRRYISDRDFGFAQEYYIPSSSLKGALLGTRQNRTDEDKELRQKSLFKDIALDKSMIKLRSLYKFQYLYQKQENGENDINSQNQSDKLPKFSEFFPLMKIEMLMAEKSFTGTVLIKGISQEHVRNRLKETFQSTKIKLNNYIVEINERIRVIKAMNLKEIDQQGIVAVLEEMEKKIQALIDSDRQMIFLGGYKGILGSLSKAMPETMPDGVQNGFYIDNDTKLPYGLVEILNG